MTLFEIDRQVQELIEQGFNADCIDLETGEIDSAKAEKFLADLDVEREIKLDNYGKYIKNMKAEAKALAEQEKVFETRRKALERKIEWFEKAVVSSLMLNGEKDFKSVNVVFTTRKSQKVEIDESNLAKKYFVKKIELKPDKKAVGELLKQGHKIKGAWMVTNINLQVK